VLLEIAGLNIDLPTEQGVRRIVRDVSFSLASGESLGVVGESGSGKTMTALALMGLLPDGAVVSGTIRFEGAIWSGLARQRCKSFAAIASR